MAAVTTNKAVELFWRIHPAICRLTGGRLLGRIGGVPVLLLTSRRSPVAVLERIARA